ncbi:peroxiredoxin family protein [Hanstruepera ponticola]|uniref:peroxiredoxin family protein n=1 Tax=Hanstruepera ponticola TaxID=2042995 RepID=UPI000CF12266|nr:TlpA disulfide reductase family protein [Hanstruepera ponticola]
MRYLFICLLAIGVVSCKNDSKLVSNNEANTLTKGTYRISLDVAENVQLPFIMEVLTPNTAKIYNADEEIVVDEISYENDSVYIKTPVFQGYMVAKILDDQSLNGTFVKADLNRFVPFRAMLSETRFPDEVKAQFDVTGNWETVFSPNSEADRYIAKGSFKQKGNTVTGTFETTTGDYRFLEGVVTGNELKLSTFDGAHAFLFTATVTDSTMTGIFYSGNHWQEPFVAKRNANYELPDAEGLTYLKEGFDKVSFSFSDAAGNTVSLEDDRFKDKVVLVQIMGTWCPNCLDESKYFTDFYKQHKDKGLEIVALAFEYVKTEEKAFRNINRLKDRLDIDYPILLAQYGTSSKSKAQEKLPMLNHVLSYPTTIFIDKKGEVRKIHTGFNGPATGEKYTQFTSEFEGFVGELLAE